MAEHFLRYPRLATSLYWMLTAIGTLYVAATLLGLTGIGGCEGPIVACDAAAYYFIDHGPYNWADAPPGVPPFRYAPPFLWVVAPFRLLSFEGFVWVWAGLHVAALIWLRAGWMLAVPGVNEDVMRGNVNAFVAVLIVLAIRYPVAWAPVILTKVTPGVGLIWQFAHRDWKGSAIALSVAVGTIAVGSLLQPELWSAWARTLASSPDNYAGIDNFLPLGIRVPLAIAMALYAALTWRAWLMPIAILLGWPGILPPALMVLAAIPRLRRIDRSPGGA